ncbi:unnamed protein product [Rotaria sp. Silwood2]|nr:unnamed protein product [Rotaria sp. Silwood2]
MNSLINILVFTVFLCSSGQALDCNTGNPCELGDPFQPQYGYGCIDGISGSVMCTCPGGAEINRRCRLCDRSNPANNVCGNSISNPNLIICLEHHEHITGYACLCRIPGTSGAALTANRDCDVTVTLPTPTIPSSSVSSVVSTVPSIPSMSSTNPSASSVSSASPSFPSMSSTNPSASSVSSASPPIPSLSSTNPSVPSVTATSGFSTTASPCINGGVFVSGVCKCPSGYNGTICEQNQPTDLCRNIFCKNNGVCAIRNPNGPYVAVCLCRAYFSGEYCEIQGTSGVCSSSSCMNGAACREVVIGATRTAYCDCLLGYRGIKCENRIYSYFILISKKQKFSSLGYFTCTRADKFPDEELHEQGKYFECTNLGGGLRLERRSCPKGLRFNAVTKDCSG